MADILSIGGKPTFDDRIVKLETHTYNPYVNTTHSGQKSKKPAQNLKMTFDLFENGYTKVFEVAD